MSQVLVLRPEPGASRTAERAGAMGLFAIKSPLFAIRPLAWQPPPAGRFDALLLTSANAARHGGAGLGLYAALPCYAVGESTAEAARIAGLRHLRVGPADAAALLEMARGDGVRSALHPCGRDHLPLAEAAVSVEAVPVYAAEAVASLSSAAVTALGDGAIALLHSPRASRVFAELIGKAGLERSGVAIAAISEAALAAAGQGWGAAAAAAFPRDAALLEVAAKLCQTDGQGVSGTRA